MNSQQAGKAISSQTVGSAGADGSSDTLKKYCLGMKDVCHTKWKPNPCYHAHSTCCLYRTGGRKWINLFKDSLEENRGDFFFSVLNLHLMIVVLS